MDCGVTTAPHPTSAIEEGRTGGNTEARRHGEKPGVGESQGRWKAGGGKPEGVGCRVAGNLASGAAQGMC